MQLKVNSKNTKIGNVRFYQKGDKTYTRIASRNGRDAKARSQLLARAPMRNIYNHWHVVKPFITEFFEGRTKKVSSYNIFTKMARLCNPVYLAKGSTDAVSAPYAVSEGSLLPIEMEENTKIQLVSNIRLGKKFSIDRETTVGNFSRAVLDNNSSFETGDEICFFGTIQKGTAEHPYIEAMMETVRLDRKSKELLLSENRCIGFCSADNCLAMQEKVKAGCYTWIHVRRNKRNGNVRVSTQFLWNRNDSFLSVYGTEESFNAVEDSYK